MTESREQPSISPNIRMRSTLTQTRMDFSMRAGDPVAAYIYLLPKGGEKAAYTLKHPDDQQILIDYTDDHRPIGIEFLTPDNLNFGQVMRLIEKLNKPEGE